MLRRIAGRAQGLAFAVAALVVMCAAGLEGCTNAICLLAARSVMKSPDWAKDESVQATIGGGHRLRTCHP